MGTRGYVIIKYKNKYYTCYNHYDSYPQELGAKIFKYIKNNVKMFDLLSIINFFKEICPKERVFYLIPDEISMRTYIMIEWFYLIDVQKNTMKIIGGYYEPVYNLLDFYKNSDEDSDYEDYSTEETIKNLIEEFDIKNEELQITTTEIDNISTFDGLAPQEFITKFL